MATKKECDRCGKQWKPKQDGEDPWGQPTDKELCLVSFNLPGKPDEKRVLRDGVTRWDKFPTVDETIEVCQECARAIYAFTKEKPSGN